MKSHVEQKSYARAVSASIYRVGGAGYVEFCFGFHGFHDFHRELLDSLRPTTGESALLVPALFSALLFQSSPCAESPVWEALRWLVTVA